MYYRFFSRAAATGTEVCWNLVLILPSWEELAGHIGMVSSTIVNIAASLKYLLEVYQLYIFSPPKVYNSTPPLTLPLGTPGYLCSYYIDLFKSLKPHACRGVQGTYNRHAKYQIEQERL